MQKKRFQDISITIRRYAKIPLGYTATNYPLLFYVSCVPTILSWGDNLKWFYRRFVEVFLVSQSRKAKSLQKHYWEIWVAFCVPAMESRNNHGEYLCKWCPTKAHFCKSSEWFLICSKWFYVCGYDCVCIHLHHVHPGQLFKNCYFPM